MYWHSCFSLQTMNPEQYVIRTHRRLLGDLSPELDMFFQYLSVNLAITIMAVLICLLLISICYNWFLSRSNRFPDHEQNHDHHVTAPIELEGISVFTYGAMSVSSPSARSSASEICAICLDEYVQEDTIRVLQRCEHRFHKDCLDQWLQMRSFTCPICRDSMIKQNAEVAGTCCIYGASVGNNTFPSIAFAYSAGRPSGL